MNLTVNVVSTDFSTESPLVVDAGGISINGNVNGAGASALAQAVTNGESADITITQAGYHPYTMKPTKTPKTAKEKEEQHRFFFWYKKENKDWIRNTLNKLGRTDLLNVLLPDTNSWKKNKRAEETKNTFDDAVPFNQRKKKVSRAPKQKKTRR